MTLVNAETGELVPTLESCEEVIERGLTGFIEVGNALLTIRDNKLYRANHDTFESYCDERWGLSRKRAYDLTSAAEVVGALSPIGDTPLPKNEAQARELAPLKAQPDKMADAMRRASEATNGKPTAKAIEEAVAEIVDREVTRREQREEDAQAIRQLTADAQAAGLDMDEERMRQRGEFSRLCRDLAALPPPAEFVKYHGVYLRERHGHQAIAAHQWLSAFIEIWENR